MTVLMVVLGVTSRWVHAHLYDKYLDVIDRTVIDKIIEARRADDVANATVNRVLEVVKAILRKAALEWEWIDRDFSFLPIVVGGTMRRHASRRQRCTATPPTAPPLPRCPALPRHGPQPLQRGSPAVSD